MNILYINHYAGSISMGMEFRPYYFAREWQKMGHKVRIIGASYSHLRKENPKVEKDFEIQMIDGVEYQWIKTGTYNGNGVARAMTMFEFCSKLWLNAKRIEKEFQPDVVIASSTYPLDTYPAQRIRKISGCKYVHETHDLWPLTLIELGGMSPSHPFIKLLGIAEKSAYSKSDSVVGVAPNEVEYMLQHGLQNKKKFSCIQNGVVLEDWDNPEELPEIHEHTFNRLHEESKFVVCYVGGHALSNSLDTLIQAAELTKDDHSTAYVLIGKGMEKERLVKEAENLPNVYFLPPVDKKQVPTALSKADALYVGAKPCSLYRYGVSMNKVYDYMMAGKPIIYGVKAYNNDVERCGCGITIEPDSPQKICKAIELLNNLDITKLEEMGIRGKKWVLKEYTYTNLAIHFLNCFQNTDETQ